MVVGTITAVIAVGAPWEAVRSGAYAFAAVQLAISVIVAARSHRVDSRITAVTGAIGVFFALSQAFDGTILGSILALVGSLCIVAGLVELLRLRHASGADGALFDALIVGLGAWIVTWVALVRPMITDSKKSVLNTVLEGFYQPASSVVVFLVAVLLFSRASKPLSLWLLGAALTLNLGGDTIYALMDAEYLRRGFDRYALLLYTAGYFCGGAAFMHPSMALINRADPTTTHSKQFGRLIVTTSSLVVPVIVLAAAGPEGGWGDTVIRSVSALVLAGSVTLRVVQSVRENSKAQDELIRGAQTDPLTGLPNRSLLLDRINECLRDAWHADKQPTLYFVDLDRFKNINDSLGHAAGDEVLVMVAQRLLNAVPAHAVVARLSGDEYVVLDPATKSPGAALALAERLLAVFREPLALSQGDVFVTASVGVAAMSPSSSSTAEDLLRHADTAMYRAKDAGRNCMALYDESMHERVAHRLSVETALYRALDRRELRLFHQPILDLESGDVVGFEALMRWQQADGTIVSPAEFIPIAEDTGTIVPIGSWALLEALTQLRRWIDDGVCSATATMSVNVSPRQLADSNFPAIVSEALTRSGVSPQLLWLEVTESMMISEPELALATLRRLRSIGVRVALDDFGTGYSSLSLLQKFPLQRIKIDRAFVQGVADNPNDRSLVRTIVAMGRSLDLDMVAEGVESVHQLQVLNDLGCTKAQGYLISHPVPPDAMRSTVAALERLGQFPGLRPNLRATERA